MTKRLAALAARSSSSRSPPSRPIRSYDYFWHLATGRWIVEHHALPASRSVRDRERARAVDQRRVAVPDRAVRAARNAGGDDAMSIVSALLVGGDFRDRRSGRVAGRRRGAAHLPGRLRRRIRSPRRSARRGRGALHRSWRSALLSDRELPTRAADDRVRGADDRLDQRPSVGASRAGAGADRDAHRRPPLDRRRGAARSRCSSIRTAGTRSSLRCD